MREETINQEDFPVLFPFSMQSPSIPKHHCQGAQGAFMAEFVPRDREFAAF